MKSNRSIPSSTVIPVLDYENVTAASEWLCRVFGLREHLRIGGHRIQLLLGDGAVVITEGASRPAESAQSVAGHSLMVRVEDVDAHKAHVEKSGGRILGNLANYPYGERQYTAQDIGGHLWTFTQTIEDVDPAIWGGVLV